MSDRELEALSIELSEDPGYFDTDNLISNEDSYTHVVPRLKEIAPSQGAFLGVGPDQNYTYLVHLRPAVTFIVDIRRDNLLQHLYLKQLVESSGDRWEFLSRLFGKRLPLDFERRPAGGPLLVREIQAMPSDQDVFERVFRETWSRIRIRFPRLCLEEDEDRLYQMTREIFTEGLGLRFRSHGRSPRVSYPTYGELILATDDLGRRWNFLNNETDFQYLKQVQVNNRLVPVIGDLAGSRAIRGIGEFLKGKGLVVSAFYVSNVEFYLFRQGRFADFVTNLGYLPLSPDTLVIRSYFNYGRGHPESKPGYSVTSLLQRMESFRSHQEMAPYLNYLDLVTREYVPLREGSR